MTAQRNAMEVEYKYAMESWDQFTNVGLNIALSPLYLMGIGGLARGAGALSAGLLSGTKATGRFVAAEAAHASRIGVGRYATEAAYRSAPLMTELSAAAVGEYSGVTLAASAVGIGGSALYRSSDEAIEFLTGVSQKSDDIFRMVPCFAAGTLVHTENGLLAIEKFTTGMKVLARDEETGEYAYKSVIGTKVTPSQKIYSVTVETAQGIETLRTTEEHPFWIKNLGWRKAGLLASGDVLLDKHDVEAFVQSVEIEKELATVYNIEVVGFHTYHVGASGIWVHNADCFEVPPTFANKTLISNKFPNEALDPDGKIYGIAQSVDGRITINRSSLPRNVDFVITADKQLILGLRHTTLANNADVLAAGEMKLSGKGDIRLINNLSGHYRPTVAESLRTHELLNEMGFKTNNAYLKFYDFTVDADGFVTNRTLIINRQLK